MEPNIIVSSQPIWKNKAISTLILAALLLGAVGTWAVVYFKNKPQPSPKDALAEAKLVPTNQEITSTISKLDKNSLTLTSGSRILTYNITHETVALKCQKDLKKPCNKSTDNYRQGTKVRIFTKGLDILFLYYE